LPFDLDATKAAFGRVDIPSFYFIGYDQTKGGNEEVEHIPNKIFHWFCKPGLEGRYKKDSPVW